VSAITVAASFAWGADQTQKLSVGNFAGCGPAGSDPDCMASRVRGSIRVMTMAVPLSTVF